MPAKIIDLDGNDSGPNGHHPFDTSLSIVPDAIDTRTSTTSLRAILSDIQNGRWRSQVTKVRSAYAQGGKKAAAPLKKSLPAALFSGTFSVREDNHLTRHSGLICVDLDELGDKLEGVRDLIAADPHTVAAFRSPTGTGLKVIFRCSSDPQDHIDSYRRAEQFVLLNFGLEIDPACKNVGRMCFVSDDPELFQADDAVPLPPVQPVQEFKAPIESKPGASLLTGKSPGDDYDLRCDMPALLKEHGWEKIGRYGWIRPGGSQISATWDKIPSRFYVFSSNAPLPCDHSYKPWHVYAFLCHNGNFSQAAQALYAAGYGDRIKPAAQSTTQSNGTQPTPASTPELRPITAFTYPSDDDPNILLGKDDYLGKGGGMLFVSHAGAGKSSWIMDACMAWGLGRAWCGIVPRRPLRCLIVQGEDSDRYIGKVVSSFIHANQLSTPDAAALAQNVQITRLKGVSGPAFFASLKSLIAAFRDPDLVIINPLYIYADGDIGRSEFAQPFLSNLDALNHAESFAYILVHHTGKPSAKGKDGKRADVEDWESVYMGFGSSYLANWPRCSALLEPVPAKPGSYMVKLGKGGYNAGVTRIVDHEGVQRREPTTRIPLRHSTGKMLVGETERPVYYWEDDLSTPVEAPAPAAKSGRPAKYDFTQFLPLFPREASKAVTRHALMRFVKDISNISDTMFRNLLNDAVTDGLISRQVKSGSYLYHVEVR